MKKQNIFLNHCLRNFNREINLMEFALRRSLESILCIHQNCVEIQL